MKKILCIVLVLSIKFVHLVENYIFVINNLHLKLILRPDAKKYAFALMYDSGLNKAIQYDINLVQRKGLTKLDD